jgi:hypothetical protein
MRSFLEFRRAILNNQFSLEQQMTIKIANSDIVTAFDDMTIGAKVADDVMFRGLLVNAIGKHDFSKDLTPGQAVLNLFADLPAGLAPDWMEHAKKCVLSGIGRKTLNANDYVCRFYRGQVHMFLKRQHAAEMTSLKAVVYTRDAYINDPDVVADKAETERMSRMHAATHVLVAILASPVESFVSPYRFVANLAGGNLDYAEGKKTYAQLVELAKKVKEFDDSWAVVAD